MKISSFEKQKMLHFITDFEVKILIIGRHLSAGLAKSLPTSPAKRFEEIFYSKNCKTVFIFQLRSKNFLTSCKKIPKGLSRLHFILQVEKVCFGSLLSSKKALFKIFWSSSKEVQLLAILFP